MNFYMRMLLYIYLTVFSKIVTINALESLFFLKTLIVKLEIALFENQILQILNSHWARA